ncbi:MAG: putative Ig domain-containing protein [Acidimicrobiales bacterium]
MAVLLGTGAGSLVAVTATTAGATTPAAAARSRTASAVTVAPSITSRPTLTAHPGVMVSFTVTTAGTPTPHLVASGRLPGGMSFTANDNGTATVAGTPSSGSAGTYTLDVTASNGVSPSATQSLVISVVVDGTVPAITSPSSYQLVVGQYRSVTVATTGTPVPVLTASGRLPGGMSFRPGTNGTATISGVPEPGSTGTYDLSIAATSSKGVAHQALVLTVVSSRRAAAITSPSSFDVRGGTYAKLTVSATGNPMPSLALSGRLPYGLHFTDAANSTGYIYGTPGRTIDASFPLEVTATNGVGTAARQSLEIHVALAPTAAFTTRASTQMTTRRYAKFEVSTLASPAARLTLSGRLPLGVRFFAKGGGHAYLAGTPWRSAAGSYTVTITASNGVAGPATQRLRIVVLFPPSAPRLSGVHTLVLRVHAYAKLRIVTLGSPVPRLTLSGRLPKGLRFVAPPEHRVVYVVGRPWVSSTGDYQLVLTAQNGVGRPVREELKIVVVALGR